MTVDATAIVGRALVDPAGWALASAGVDGAALLEAAVRHRVLLLLGWTLRAAGRLDDSPPEFVETFQRTERAAVIEDVVRHTELVHVLEALSAAGVRALLFKGAALGYTHYPAAYLRVRADTDLLVIGEIGIGNTTVAAAPRYSAACQKSTTWVSVCRSRNSQFPLAPSAIPV